MLFVVLPGKVTLPQLTVLKYKDKEQCSKKVHILENAKHKWKEIASLICSTPNRISTLEKKHNNDAGDCCREVFIECFINGKPEGAYSPDWNGLIELLNDVDLKTLAEETRSAIGMDN